MLKRFLEETTTKQLHLTVFCQAFPNIFESFLLQFWRIKKNFKKRKKKTVENWMYFVRKRSINLNPFVRAIFAAILCCFYRGFVADFNAHDFLIVIQQLS